MFFFLTCAFLSLQWLESNPGAEEDEFVAKLKEIETVANPIISRCAAPVGVQERFMFTPALPPVPTHFPHTACVGISLSALESGFVIKISVRVLPV